MLIKLTYKFVKAYIESFNYILLSTEYKNVHSKLKVRCPNDHIFLITYNNFKQGRRCAECSGNKNHTYDIVKAHIESFGYLLLSIEYKNTRTKLRIQCQEGHVFEITYASFKQGCRCAECVGLKKLTNKEIIEKLNLVEDIRENKNGEIEVTCKLCGKYHVPNRRKITHRIQYVNGLHHFESLFYCSEECKNSCPIFRKQKYPEGLAPNNTRELQPELRKLVLERDNYTCVKCKKHQSELDYGLICHHIDPVINNPVESADIDNCITLCKDCHAGVHQIPGCELYNLRCTIEDKELNKKI
jgi:hypothetical protein